METAVLTMSDIHFGKRTAHYSPEALTSQLARIADRLQVIRRSMGEKQVDKLVVAILGDVNDGSGIYPTQEHHLAISNPVEQADSVSDLLAGWMLVQKEVWGDVEIHAVPGNHGRVGKFAHEAANWDNVTYRYLSMKLMGQIPVTTPQSDTGIHTFDIRGHKILMYHGHRIGFGGGMPFTGIRQRINGWLSTKAVGQFDVALFGHFHVLSHVKVNRIHVLTSGTPVVGDDWGLQQGWENSNDWWLFGVSDLHPISWQYTVNLL